MRHKKNAFIDTIMDLWAQIDLRPVAVDPFGPVQLTVDNVDLVLSKRSDDHILIEALVQPIADDKKRRIQQLRTALKINLGLALSCRASLNLVQNNNASYLAAHSLYPLRVNNTRYLIEIINDNTNLVEFFRHASNKTRSSKNNKPLDRDQSSMVIIAP